MMPADKNILITTLGTTWAVVPELIGYTNPRYFDLYRYHPEKSDVEGSRKEFAIPEVNDVWVVTTEAMDASIESLTKWQQKMIPDIELKIYPCTGVSDLSSTRDCNRMADLIFRAVLHASRQTDKLPISLAGEQTNFRRLYTLSPEQIRQLKDRHIGTDTDMAAQELAWLQALPKADLHCHFGGILSIEEMIEAAGAEAENIAARCGTDPEFLSWNNQIQTAVKYRNTEFLADQMAGSGEALRHMFGQVPEPLSVCAFLLAFEAVPALLDELAEDEFCRFQLIFIASRHGAMEKIQQHIYLAMSLAESNPVFKDHFSGFDLAGAETAKQPGELREAFLPLMEQCVQFTIHAGEDEPVENIWQQG
jgi:hypothetical protein